MIYFPDEEYWRSTDDERMENWVIISHLQQGVAYQIRVVTKGDFGESASMIEQYTAGSDPGNFRAIVKNITCRLRTIHRI